MEKNNSYAPGFRPHCISVTGYLFFLLNFFLLQVLDDRDVLLIQTVYSPCDAPRNVSLDNHCYLTNYNVFRINLLRFKLHGDILICCIRTTTRVIDVSSRNGSTVYNIRLQIDPGMNDITCKTYLYIFGEQYDHCCIQN